jgi:hypothetical protein
MRAVARMSAAISGNEGDDKPGYRYAHPGYEFKTKLPKE